MSNGRQQHGNIAPLLANGHIGTSRAMWYGPLHEDSGLALRRT